jgi:mono/diheme cytochrome c family protein
MRKTLSWSLVGAAIVLVAGAALFVTMTRRLAGTDSASSPDPAPAKAFTPRPLRDITVSRSPERVARGQYLSEGLLQCFVCHSERDWSKAGAPPVPALKGAGAVWPGRPWLTAPNLTPDKDTGVGTRTDDMLIRAIREGISHDGRVLHPQMWYSSFRVLPDEDVEAVVAYLRSLKPIRRVLPKTDIPPDRAKELRVPEPIAQPVPVVVPASDIERGRRLAFLADCSGCHTSWYTPKNPGLYGGGNLIERLDRKTYSSNITSDDSGIAHYDAAFFREAIRTGKARGRELSPLMPWIVFRNLNDQDLDALFAYLQALPKVKHVIDNIDAPTKCRICEGEHPLGQYNKPPEVRLVPLQMAELKGAPGTYRFEDGYEVRLAIEGGKLHVKFDDGGGCELVTADRQTYFCEGDIFRIQFVRDGTSRITGITDNLEPARKVR